MTHSTIQNSNKMGFTNPYLKPWRWCGKQWLQISSPVQGSLGEKVLKVASNILAAIPLAILTALTALPTFFCTYFSDIQLHQITYQNVPLSINENIRDAKKVYTDQTNVFKQMNLSYSHYLEGCRGFTVYVHNYLDHLIGKIIGRILLQKDTPPELPCILQLFSGKLTFPAENIYSIRIKMNEALTQCSLTVDYF